MIPRNRMLAPAESRQRTHVTTPWLCARVQPQPGRTEPMLLALALALAALLAAFVLPLLTPYARRQRATARLGAARVLRDLRRPVIVGYRRNGCPVYAVGGADDTATLTLEQERDQLLERLANPQDGDNVGELATQAAALAQRITEHNAAVTSAESARAALLGATVARQTATAPATGGGAPSGRADDPRDDPQARHDAARVVRAGEAFQTALRERPGGEGTPTRLERYRETMGRMEIVLPGEVRALFDTANNVNNMPRVPGVVQQQDQALQVLDLIDRQSMTSTSIEWVQESTAPNAAAEVAHGALKPEATFVLTLKTDTAATVAHWVNITRQALDDDTMLRGYVEGRLSYGLMKRVNGQILNGNGTAPNLRGILNTSGIGTFTAATATEAAILSVRKAKTVAQLSEYDPDGVVMNPVDWEAVELSADTTGQWRLAASAATGAAPRVWGLAVVSTTAITGTTFGTTGGTFLVGAFRTGATLWERTGVQVFITDSHASNFTSNILTLLAELRAALTVWRPLAFVKGTFGASRA